MPVHVVEVKSPASVCRRDESLDRAVNALKRADQAITALIDFHAETAPLFSVPVNRRSGELTFQQKANDVLGLLKLYSVSGIRLQSAPQAIRDSYKSLVETFGEDGEATITKITDFDKRRQKLLSDAYTAVIACNGPISAVIKTLGLTRGEALQISEKVNAWSELKEELLRPSKNERKTLKKLAHFETITWSDLMPAESYLRYSRERIGIVALALQEIAYRANNFELENAAISAVRDLASEMVKPQVDTAASVSALAGPPASPIANEPKQPLPPAPKEAPVNVSETTAPEIAAPELSASILPPAIPPQIEVPSRNEKDTPPPAADVNSAEESELVAGGLATYVLDPEKRAAAAAKLTLRAFEYRMGALDSALPDFNRPYDAHLEDLQAILMHNSGILTLPDEEFSAFIRQLSAVGDLRAKFPNFGGASADPQSSPQSFESATALKTLTAVLERRAEYQDLKAGLEKQGWDADAVMTLLRKGFFFHGRLHVGKMLVAKVSMIRNNVEFYSDHQGVWENQKLENVLTKLIQARAVQKQGDNSGFSLNPNGVSSELGPAHEILVKAIHWIIHNPNPRVKYEE